MPRRLRRSTREIWRHTWRSAHHRLDRVLTRGGTRGVFLVFVLVVVVWVVLTAVVRNLLAGSESWPNSAWEALRHLIDVSSVDDDDVSLRAWDIVQACLGLGFVAIFTALVITRFQDLLAEARAGRTRLAMDVDLLVVGWSDQVPAYLRELNAGPAALMTRRYRVGILVDSSATMPLDEVREVIGREAATEEMEIELRVGVPWDLDTLRRVRAEAAPRILITAAPTGQADSRTLLIIFGLLRCGFDFQRQRCVAEMYTADGERMAREVTAEGVVVVNPSNILALLVTQAVRAQGMSQVVDQLISYKGCEIYFHAVPEALEGVSFVDAIRRAENCSPIGVCSGGDCVVRPPMEWRLAAGDELVFIAQDERTPSFAAENERSGLIAEEPAVTRDDVRVLVAGWSEIAEVSMRELRGFLGKHATVDVLICGALVEERHSSERAQPWLSDVKYRRTVTDYHQELAERAASGAYDVVAILPYRGGCSPAQSDAYTMMAMTVVRRVVLDNDLDTRIVGELRSSAHSQLAELAAPDDLIVSEALSASLAVQLVDRPQTRAILADLLDYRGSVFYVRPLSGYDASPGVTYADLVDDVVRRGEVPIGLRIAGQVELDPDRSRLLTGDVTGVVVVARGTEDAGVQTDLSAVAERWKE